MSQSYYDMEEFFATLMASGMLVFIIILLGVAILFAIAAYVLQSLALYKMAKKMGHESPWLAWIPYANTYLMFVLPEKPYSVLAINTVMERSTAFMVWLGLSVGSGVITTILSFIPLIGTMIASFVPLLIRIALIFILYPMYKDLFSLFVDDSQATVFAIVGILVPITMIVFLLIASAKEPRPLVQIEGTANYY